MSILREIADLPDDVDALAAAMNRLGLAVEEVTEVGIPVPGVVTARITRTESHPDAAKVTRCWVDAGDGVERHVWCGATNMGPGDVVPLATIGTTMPDGRVISRRGILGIDSEGMLCSAPEIGLGEDRGGLLILPKDTTLGQSPFDALRVERDVIFDLDLTRNRPDCWGHLGVARDLAAHFGTATKGPRSDPGSLGPARLTPISIEAPERCGVFTLSFVSGVRVAPSPAWVVQRLNRLGMRSINNVVDASNLVMLELNQPNHAYDADVVRGFRIRMGRPGETITTLDGQVRSELVEDLLICDDASDTPVGLAGIMGDEHSEITETTTTLAFECAWFAPDPIRFSAQRHGLRTEASIRFERGVDPFGWIAAAERFVTILRETSPEAVLHADPVVATSSSNPQTRTAVLRPTTVERTLGVTVPLDEAAKILEGIGFVCQPGDDGLRVDIPRWRPDCVDEIDLVEEVARHFGYERIGRRVPHSTVHGRLSEFQARRRTVRRVLQGLGLDEAMPSPFLAPGDLSRAGLDESQALRLSNPLVADESVLRTSLRPGLLSAIRYNQSHRARRIALWEIGHVYPRSSGQLPDEAEFLAVVVAGSGVEDALTQWSLLADALSIGAQVDQSRVPPGMHPTRSAALARGKSLIGTVGEIHPMVLEEWGVTGPVSLLELNLSVVLAERPKAVQARSVNRHPSSDIDMSFVVPDSVPAGTVQRALRQAAGARLVEIELHDVYRGQGVPVEARSLTFRMRLQEVDATLTEAAVAEVIARCTEAVAREGGSLRASHS